jgi:hypothetical protein
VKLDFDNTPLDLVEYWAKRACNWFKLEGGVILKSSNRSYHVVFNRVVSWDRNMHILCWVALESHNDALLRYELLQGIKESSTLRIGPKGGKSPPRVVYRWGKQDMQIRKYLNERKKINKLLKSLRICPLLSFQFRLENS